MSLHMQSVALLDVDHTLLFGMDESMNLTLLNSLLDANITRVYLFTDMTFSQHTVAERNGILKQLEEMGFCVHGVITPNDVAWSQVTDDEATTLHTMCLEDRTYSGKFYGSEFNEFVMSQRSVLPQYAAALSHYEPHLTLPGVAFSDACLELHATAGISDVTKKRSIFAKVLADHLAAHYGYKHNKGLLMDLFLRHKPDWVSGILVFDDNASVIEDIQHFTALDIHRLSTDAAQLACADVPISMVPVTSDQLSAEYYNNIIRNHLARS